jgi:DNA-binding LacI/PurR family transcriptional regulator
MSARRAGQGPTYQATLAYVTDVPPDRRGWFDREFGKLFAGARAQAGSKGYQLEEFNLNPLADHRPRSTEILLARGIHGLMLAPLHSVDKPVPIDWSHFATVAFGYSFTQAPVSRVAHNTFGGYLLAVQHCRATGRRRPGLVLQQRVHEKVEKRWLAAALLDQSEHPAKDQVPPLLLDGLDERAFRRWHRQHRPDAILCVDTGPVLSWLKPLRCKVPATTAVVGLDRRPRRPRHRRHQPGLRAARRRRHRPAR